jgi:hypothetical protein
MEMKTVRNRSSNDSFALSDRVLLLFNEHDTRIALNWEPSGGEQAPDRGGTPAAPSQL